MNIYQIDKHFEIKTSEGGIIICLIEKSGSNRKLQFSIETESFSDEKQKQDFINLLNKFKNIKSDNILPFKIKEEEDMIILRTDYIYPETLKRYYDND